MPHAQGRAGANVSLEALVSRAERAGKGAPPVESWNPAHCGAIDMVINEDGGWSYNGSPIARERLVRLFSTVLRREADGSFVLVTPAEKLTISVHDVPFMAVEMSVGVDAGGRKLTFRTNVGDLVEAGPAHPLRLVSDEGGFRPYVRVRGGLDARLTRTLAYDLAELVEERGGVSGIEAGGAWFPLSSSGTVDA